MWRSAFDPDATLAEATAIAAALKQELAAHMPALEPASVTFVTSASDEKREAHVEHGHHHAPEPFKVSCGLAEGLLEIVDTPAGERMRLSLSRHAPGLLATVNIKRRGSVEGLTLSPTTDVPDVFESTGAPAEPHEFDAELGLTDGGRRIVLPFRMVEPQGHSH